MRPVRISRPGDPVPDTGTDWAKLDALSDAELHAAALADPDAPPLSDGDPARLTKLVNVKKLRERLGQTQEVSPPPMAFPWVPCGIGSSAGNTPMPPPGPISR